MPIYTLFATLTEAKARIPVGKIFTVRLPDMPVKVCVVQRADGTWRAFLDACPHKKASLSMGGYLNNEGEVLCPLHHYAFELETGQETTGQTCGPLQTFELLVNEKGLQIRVL